MEHRRLLLGRSRVEDGCRLLQRPQGVGRACWEARGGEGAAAVCACNGGEFTCTSLTTLIRFCMPSLVDIAAAASPMDLLLVLLPYRGDFGLAAFRLPGKSRQTSLYIVDLRDCERRADQEISSNGEHADQFRL